MTQANLILLELGLQLQRCVDESQVGGAAPSGRGGWWQRECAVAGEPVFQFQDALPLSLPHHPSGDMDVAPSSVNKGLLCW